MVLLVLSNVIVFPVSFSLFRCMIEKKGVLGMIILQYIGKAFSFMHKDIPETHVKCHVCAGTGAYDIYTDCLTCNAKGLISKVEYNRRLEEGEI